MKFDLIDESKEELPVYRLCSARFLVSVKAAIILGLAVPPVLGNTGT